MDNTFICKECNQPKKHYGKGACKECYMRAYRQTPEYKARRAEQERQRRATGKADAAEKKRSSTERRIAWRRNYHQKRYAENRQKALDYQKEYRRKNRAKLQQADTERKKLLRLLAQDFQLRDWYEILEENDWKCFYCKAELEKPERDHKTPISRGGLTTRDNLVPTCHSCNSRKGDRTVDEYRQFLLSIGETPIF